MVAWFGLVRRAALTLLVWASLFSCGESGSLTGTQEIVFESGRVVVVPEPLSIWVENTTGDVALRLLERKQTAGETLYAPLGLVTGDDPELRYQVLDGAVGPQPDVNPSDPVPPSRYAVTGVATMHRDGEALVVVLMTDDPRGRTIELRIEPDDSETVAFEATVRGAPGATGIFASFAAAEDEAFHGFGGRRESTDLRGGSFQNWVQDYRFPKVSTGYYYSQSLFFSSAGYGLFLDSDALAAWRMASDLDDAWRVLVQGTTFRTVITPGEAPSTIRRITELTGRHRVAPSWSLGPTLSRTVRTLPGFETVETYKAKVLDDLSMIETLDLGLDAYVFEGWATLGTAFVEDVIERLEAEGLRPVLYIRSFVAEDSEAALTEPPERFGEAVDAGYVAKTSDGQPYLYPSSFNGMDAAVIDFTNSAAWDWWKGLVKEMLELGADGFMNDFGEQVLADMVFADGSTGAAMHNRYPVLQHEATREAVDEFVAEHPEREIFFYVRAGYGGRPGSAAFESATFPGDETVDWGGETGLRSIVPDMLNRAIGGAYGFTTDIGGYMDLAGGTSKELYVRWAQAAVFTTHFRVHGCALSGVRMPWFFEPGDPEPKVLDLWQAAADLHVRARPLMLALWEQAVETGMPITRPLWLNDPADEGNAHNDDQWLVGPNLLVAPVMDEGATEREVWLPEGCWQLHGEGDEHEGRTMIMVDAPLHVLPWFTRCGASPLGDAT